MLCEIIFTPFHHIDTRLQCLCEKTLIIFYIFQNKYDKNLKMFLKIFFKDLGKN